MLQTTIQPTTRGTKREQQLKPIVEHYIDVMLRWCNDNAPQDNNYITPPERPTNITVVHRPDGRLLAVTIRWTSQTWWCTIFRDNDDPIWLSTRAEQFKRWERWVTKRNGIRSYLKLIENEDGTSYYAYMA